ncbi:MAG: alpha/beta hydrolase [Parvibaculum sp.]|nr:alpha/beta hydrolase [Parvibaculum sp.]
MTWPRDAGSVRGTVFMFGGRTEFAEKYFEVAGELLERGFAVATVDWRGQGLSDRALADPRKGHVVDYAEFDQDFATFMRDVAPTMPRPWIGLAHSMGGNVLMRAMHDHPDMFAAVALSAPMLGLRLGSPFVSGMLGLVAAAGNRSGFAGRYVPGGSSAANDVVPFEHNILTHDRARYALHQLQIAAEPKIGLGSATYGWLAASFRSIRKVMQTDYLTAIKTPVLIVVAGADRLIDRDALVAAAANVEQGELSLIEGSNHEVLIETDEVRIKFWAAFDKFIDRHLRPNPR